MSERERHERLLDPALVEGLETRPIEQIRALRRACVDYESGLSYLRRLIQGSIDILEGELERRSAGDRPEEPGELIAALPDLLGDAGRPSGPGRPPTSASASLEPAELDDELAHRYEALVRGGDLARAAELGPEDLHRLLTDLHDIERRVSERRHAFHHRIDALQAELTRRYRTGEATVDSLLDA